MTPSPHPSPPPLPRFNKTDYRWNKERLWSRRNWTNWTEKARVRRVCIQASPRALVCRGISPTLPPIHLICQRLLHGSSNSPITRSHPNVDPTFWPYPRDGSVSVPIDGIWDNRIIKETSNMSIPGSVVCRLQYTSLTSQQVERRMVTRRSES